MEKGKGRGNGWKFKREGEIERGGEGEKGCGEGREGV